MVIYRPLRIGKGIQGNRSLGVRVFDFKIIALEWFALKRKTSKKRSRKSSP